MANHAAHHLLHSPSNLQKKKLTGQRKREELEKEVSMLQKLLNQEEKVHEILESVNKHKNSSSFAIPNFLPSKVKEVLAEMGMVESEIARLEIQISQLQKDLKTEKQTTKEYSSNSKHSSESLTRSTIPTFDTKALHFISKAIEFNPPQNKHFPTNTPILKSPFTLQKRNAAVELPPKYVPIDHVQQEDKIQNWLPNKLSESILKCLNLIYVRLLRTSRAIELEKLGPISRSLYSSFNSSRSFRVENSSNSTPFLHKELRQQDPYAIFDSELESIPRDIGPYKHLVIFTSTSMDPKSLSNPSSIPLLTKLRVMMSNLQRVDLRPLTYQQKLAFWINIYNACIMHGFLQYGVPSSPEKLASLMNKATLNIGGNILNAQAIEHYILRKPHTLNREGYQKSEKDDKEATIRKLYGLDSLEPNVTFALCCGTRSSPAVRVYTAEAVSNELERSKLEYLQASIVVTSLRRIALPELLVRNLHDFAVDMNSLIEWICHQLPTSGTLRKSMVDCFRGHTKMQLGTLEKLPYDFEFQYILAI